MQNGYIRKGLYKVNDVLSKLVPVNTQDNDSTIDFDDDLIKMNSHRYELFKHKGIECVSCGIEGVFFAKEKDSNAKSYHFNLYALANGKEVLMTKNHITPIRKGGLAHISNYQTMCVHCNCNSHNKQVADDKIASMESRQ